jgi:hypothetical protein
MTEHTPPMVTPLDTAKSAPVGGITALVASLPAEYQVRLTESVSQAAQVAGTLGIGPVDLDTLLGLESVRLNTLGDVALDEEKLRTELLQNAGIAARITELRSTEADRQVTDAKLAGMRPQDRISYARQHGLTTAPKTSVGMTQAEALQVAAQLSPAARIGFWRDFKAGK